VITDETAVTMADDEGRQFHLGLKNGELAQLIMLCGDVDRIDIGRGLFESIEFETQRREFRTITGMFRGKNMSLMSTGIGPDNTEIAVIESCQIVEKPVFIRVGSCGGLQEYVSPGDLVISTGSIAYENTSTFFVPECFPAIADHQILQHLIDSCLKLDLKHHVGLTATTPGFYGSQGRGIGRFRPLEDFRIEELHGWNVLNFEMEASCLFRLATIGGARAGAICACFNNRITDEVIGVKDKDKSEEECIRAAMTALTTL
jgi:uridine phosphorylase